MNQEQVRDIYLRVIDATIEGVRVECTERGADESTLQSLVLLKSRWSTRLTHTHAFDDDPDLIEKPSSSSAAKGGKKAAGKNAKKKAASPKSPKPSSSRNGLISVAALTNQDDSTTPGRESVPGSEVQVGKPEPFLARARDVKTEDEPPAKRPRQEIDDGNIDHGGEDLDSSDSDARNNDSDEEPENLVLAQHEKVKKGPKWKVSLREGIVSIRGREYLFNKATCDLDF